MMLELAQRFKVPDGIHSRRFGSELIVLQLNHGEYFSLDPLGASIWDLVVAGRTLQDVTESLGPRFDVEPEQFQRDVFALIQALVEKGLLIPLGLG